MRTNKDIIVDSIRNNIIVAEDFGVTLSCYANIEIDLFEDVFINICLDDMFNGDYIDNNIDIYSNVYDGDKFSNEEYTICRSEKVITLKKEIMIVFLSIEVCRTRMIEEYGDALTVALLVEEFNALLENMEEK